MATVFVDRGRELASLEQRYASHQAELYVLYGRRRVGKTELLHAFCRDKRHIFFVADLGTEVTALAELTRRISAFAHDDPDLLAPFPSWDAVFNFLIRLAAQERLVLILDEFTYLIRANPAVPSILQRLWDTRLRETNIMLVLCGSYVGMMEKHVLAYDAPLYGRRTAQWHLQPLPFADALLLLSPFDPVDQMRAYAVLGGIPAYLLQINARRPLLENIEQHILSTGTFLYDEPRFLLLQELGDPNRHFAILEAVAAGRTRPNEIAQAAGIAATSLPFYLDTLRALGLIEREVPATEIQPHKSKRGIYRLADNYFRFWFRYVFPNRSLLERGEIRQVGSKVSEQFDQFTALAYEAVCREHIWQLYHGGRLAFVPRTVGSWWDNREQIDIVALGDQHLLVGECKWSSRPVGTNILDDLQRKARLLAARGAWSQVQYALFARAGFTPALIERARHEGVLLLDLDVTCRRPEGRTPDSA